MRRMGKARAAYRWGLLALSVVVWARCFGDARLEEFGWQFRLIEVWAVTGTVLAAALMVRLSMGWSRSRHEELVGGVAAVNVVVLALHLGPLGVWSPTLPGWHGLALNVVVPAAQIADAVLILGAFRRVRGAVAWSSSMAAAYVVWIELAVRPLNASVEGRGGLPYPPLDAMPLSDRLGLYAAVTLLGLAVLPGLAIVQRRFVGDRAADRDGIAA